MLQRIGSVSTSKYDVWLCTCQRQHGFSLITPSPATAGWMFGIIAVVAPTSDICRWVFDALFERLRFRRFWAASVQFSPCLFLIVRFELGTILCCTHPSFRDFQIPDHVHLVFISAAWRQRVTDQKLSANRWAGQTRIRHSCGDRSDEIIHEVIRNMQKYFDVEDRGKGALIQYLNLFQSCTFWIHATVTSV